MNDNQTNFTLGFISATALTITMSCVKGLVRDIVLTFKSLEE